ncbi:hypothetical protein RB623_13575 [Mesorhizobium sp. LHD-90]|uniref:hypothetical protein n=1 Tax=Mesorhizobium sp. LHD-90 TaxID=3071414 RepID=UPI0027E0E278|nr:hypothetical protein [Mesorhizobium sp. LHD-90]MDQ6435081.1 hypothetical protein [Mesorhizobium sp. LHD-90]
MTRVIFLLIFLIGAGIGFAYPWAMQNRTAHEIGTWRVGDAGGFQPIDARLTGADAPVKAVIDLAAVLPQDFDAGARVLTITAATDGRTVLANTLTLDSAEKREESPQTHLQVFRIEAGSIPEVGDAGYTFTVGPGDAEGIRVSSVDLLLFGGGSYDQRAQPVGFSLMAIGMIGFLLTFRRRADGGNGGTKPPPKPRWGRDAGQP